jgi:hypothetical protein
MPERARWSVQILSGTWTFKVTAPTCRGRANCRSSRPRSLVTSTAGGRARAGKTFPLTLNVKDAADSVASATARVSYDDSVSPRRMRRRLAARAEPPRATAAGSSCG